MNKFKQKSLKNSIPTANNLEAEKNISNDTIIDESLEIIIKNEPIEEVKEKEPKSVFEFSIEETFNFRKKIEKLENNLNAYKTSASNYSAKLEKINDFINKRDNLSMDDDLDNLRIRLILKDEDDRYPSEEPRAIKDPFVLQKFIEAVLQFLNYKIQETEQQILTTTNNFINH